VEEHDRRQAAAIAAHRLASLLPHLPDLLAGQESCPSLRLLQPQKSFGCNSSRGRGRGSKPIEVSSESKRTKSEEDKDMQE